MTDATDVADVDHTIEVLNRIHAADPTVLPALCEFRVPCNEAVAEDPTVQVFRRDGADSVGLLGILNGIFGIREGNQGFIAIRRDDDGVIVGFGRTG
jgi:hypothetical protein